MTGSLEEMLADLKKMLLEQERFEQAYRLVSYDQQTICPPMGQQDAGEVLTILQSSAYRIRKREEFIRIADELYRRKDELDEWDRALVEMLHTQRLREKNITPAQQEQFDRVSRQAWLAWNRAREAKDYSLFAEALEKRRDADLKRSSLWDRTEGSIPEGAYDGLLDEYERGMSTAVLDRLFGDCLPAIESLLTRIKNSKKKIRTEFLSRPVEDAQQKEMAEYLLHLLGFDFRRGTWGLSPHPFTERIGRGDVRITTHYEKNSFLSSIYSVIHECGHALFEQLQPAESLTHFIADRKTMGQHETISRFYENIIGRSEAFIRGIYPEVKRIFPQVMEDVSERELYEAVNLVQPSLIRTDADELTYTLHIIIRYEIEAGMMEKRYDMAKLNEVWDGLYERYLGVRPSSDLEGILQDVHWTDSFGYFPSYALGNLYGAMILKRMQQDIDPCSLAEKGDFARINGWMREHVFARADLMNGGEWIRRITGREFTAGDYLAYLEKKYTAVYEL